jgi:hypothetical protein
VISHDQGILCAPTAFGTTVVAACLIAKRAVNALILVHRRQLMDQWRERLAAFLDLPIGNIGQFGGGKSRQTGMIDVACCPPAGGGRTGAAPARWKLKEELGNRVSQASTGSSASNPNQPCYRWFFCCPSLYRYEFEMENGKITRTKAACRAWFPQDSC